MIGKAIEFESVKNDKENIQAGKKGSSISRIDKNDPSLIAFARIKRAVNVIKQTREIVKGS
jgi:hypothetical protein